MSPPATTTYRRQQHMQGLLTKDEDDGYLGRNHVRTTQGKLLIDKKFPLHDVVVIVDHNQVFN